MLDLKILSANIQNLVNVSHFRLTSERGMARDSSTSFSMMLRAFVHRDKNFCSRVMANQSGLKRKAAAPTASGTVYRKSKSAMKENTKSNPSDSGVRTNKSTPKSDKNDERTPKRVKTATDAQHDKGNIAPKKSVSSKRSRTKSSLLKRSKEQDDAKQQHVIEPPVNKPTKAEVVRLPETGAQDRQQIKETHSHKGINPGETGPLPKGIRIVAGTYERFLYGLEGTVQKDSQSSYSIRLEPRFIFPAHVSSIRCVACAGQGSKWLATGGMDELIKVWDLRRRKEMGALTGHEGTITSLSFPNRTFLLSASEDGVINMYRTRDWALLRTLRGHTGRINSVSAHPSGRVALSVGADRMIRMWDLMRGMGSASVKIGTEADRVLWDTLGTRFAVLTGRKIIVYATNMSKVAQIEHPKRLHDIGFVRSNIIGNNDKRDDQHELMLVASEAGILHVFDLDDLQGTGEDASPREVARLVGHTNRVRSAVATHVQANDGTEHLLVTTISSDGYIRVFELCLSREEPLVPELEALAAYDTKKSRLTCLSAVGFDPDASDLPNEEEAESDDSDPEDSDFENADDTLQDNDLSDEDSDAELARLEEEIAQARKAGIIVEGVDEEDDDDDDGDDNDEEEDEVEGELEDEEEDT